MSDDIPPITCGSCRKWDVCQAWHYEAAPVCIDYEGCANSGGCGTCQMLNDRIGEWGVCSVNGQPRGMRSPGCGHLKIMLKI